MRNIIKYMMSFILTLSLANIALAQDVKQPQPSEDTDNSEPASALASTRKFFTITIGTEPEEPLNTTEPEAPLDKDASAESVVSLEEDPCRDFLYKKDEISEFDDTEICVDKDNNVWHKPVQCGTNQELYKGICVSILETVLEIEVDGGAEFGVFAEDLQFEFGTGVYVNWGDGAEDVAVFRETPTEPEYREIRDKEYILDKLTPEIKHTYQKKGTYTVKVKSADGVSFFDRGSFADKIKGEMTYSTQETKVINVKVRDYGNIQNNAFQYVKNFNKGLPETTMVMTNTDNMPLNAASGRRDYYVGHISREKTPSTNLAPSASSTGGGVSSGGGSGDSSGRRGGSSWVGRSGGSSGGASNTTTPAITIINPSSTSDGETSPIPSTDIDIPTLIPDNETILESTPVTPITPIEEHYEPITDVKVTISVNPANINGMTCDQKNSTSASGCYCDTSKYYYTKENCDGELIGKICDDGTTVYAEKCSLNSTIDDSWDAELVSTEDKNNMTCLFGQKVNTGGKNFYILYEDCYCDPSKYSYTEKNCPGVLQGEICYTGEKVYYEYCITSTECDSYSNIKSQYGCAKYYEDCPFKCEIPADNNCPNREDNIGEYGACAEYWEDCSAKCKTPGICEKNECMAFTLTEKPVDPHMTSYESCTVGCGDNQTSYKITGCREGFTVSGDRTKCVKIEENDCSDYLYPNKVIVRDAFSYFESESCTDKNGTHHKPLICNVITTYNQDGRKIEKIEYEYPVNNICVNPRETILEIEVDAGAEFGFYPHNGTNAVIVDWGDGTVEAKVLVGTQLEESVKYYENSGTKTNVRGIAPQAKHIYTDKGTYTVKVKSRDGVTFFDRGMFLSDSGDDYVYHNSSSDIMECGEKYCDDHLKTKVNKVSIKEYGNVTGSDFYYIEHLVGPLPSPAPAVARLFEGYQDYRKHLSGGFPSIVAAEGYQSTEKMFSGCIGLIGRAPKIPDEVSNVTSMFENTGISNISDWSFLPSQIESTNGMFRGCKSLKELPDWSTLPQSIKDMSFMFAESGMKAVPDLSNLPANLENISFMFSKCNLDELPELKNLPDSIKDMSFMFKESGATGAVPDLSDLPEKLENIEGLFSRCYRLTGNIPDLSNLPEGLNNMSSLFGGCSSLTGNIPDLSNLPKGLKDISSLFSGCTKLTGKIPDLSNLPKGITRMTYMFYYCSGLEGDIPDLSKLPEQADIQGLFAYCTGLTGKIPDLSMLKQKDLSYVFEYCKNLTGPVPALPKGLEQAVRMFFGCGGLTGELPELPKTLDNATRMFQGCTGLTGSVPELPVCSYAPAMFDGCQGLSGDAPAKPEGFGNSSGMFYGTNIKISDEWPINAFKFQY